MVIPTRRRILKGFTLIELLIVVAIIAILAAIAVPNFLEAQVRAKVSRVKSDMRTIASALEAYYVDHNRYPRVFMDGSGDMPGPAAVQFLTTSVNPNLNNPNIYDYIDVTGRSLTTPIAYLTSVPYPSPFQSNEEFYKDRGYLFMKKPATGVNPRYQWYGFSEQWGNENTVWALMDGGPNRIWFTNPEINPPNEVLSPYDPTNGTLSPGNIWRTNQGITN